MAGNRVGRNREPTREEVVEQFTIDSSVIVASLLEAEPKHSEALKIWEEILKGKIVKGTGDWYEHGHRL